MVENSIEKTLCCMLEEIFDFSSFEVKLRITLKFRDIASKINNVIFSKWLVDEELAENSSLHFEFISTIVA